MSVLDASVVLKWFVAENDSDKAVRLREEYSLGEREIESIRTFFDMGIEIVTPTYSLLERAISMARNFNILLRYYISCLS